MKRIFIIIFAMLLIFTFSGCNRPNEGTVAPTSPAEETSFFDGLLLPEKMTVKVDGSDTEVRLNWGENSCDFVMQGYSFQFNYNESSRSINATVASENETVDLGSLCVFDDKGRIVSISFRNENILTFDYSSGKMTVVKCIEQADGFNMVLEADMANNKVLKPPFKDESFLFFTENGDVLGDDKGQIFSYEYDQNKNMTKMKLFEGEEDSSIRIAYSDAPMTALWQRIPVKIASLYYFGTSYAALSMDFMCMGINYYNAVAG